LLNLNENSKKYAPLSLPPPSGSGCVGELTLAIQFPAFCNLHQAFNFGTKGLKNSTFNTKSAKAVNLTDADF
jgi:hypothetical protein